MAGIEINENRKRAHFTFIWTIKNAPRGAVRTSRTFTVQSMEMTKWKLIVWISEDRRVVICIERAGEDKGPKSLEIEFEFSFLDASGSSLVQTSCTKDFQNYTSSKWLEFPETDVIPKQKRDKFYSKVTLTIRCRIWRTRTEISKSELCFATTRFDVHKRSCLWTVENFSSLQLGEERTLILNPTTEGCLQLTLTLFLAKNNGKECVYVEIKESDPIYQYDIEAEIAVINNEGMVFLSKQSSAFVYKSCFICKFSICEKAVLMSDETVLLSEDVLLLQCEIELSYRQPTFNKIEDYKLMNYSSSKTLRTQKDQIHLDSQNERTQKAQTHFNTQDESAVCPFKEIVCSFKDDKILSDVSLRSGTVSFPVHKLILSSRSPIFKAMFTKDMKEKTSTCIDIPDMDAETLDRLLLYVYKDKFKKLTWEAAANLFQAADKYEFLDLKEKCSNFLKSNLSVSNVCDILVLSDMHHDENLRMSVLYFIQKNSEIIYSEGWKVFKQNHSKLAWETAEKIIYKMNIPNLK